MLCLIAAHIGGITPSPAKVRENGNLKKFVWNRLMRASFHAGRETPNPPFAPFAAFPKKEDLQRGGLDEFPVSLNGDAIKFPVRHVLARDIDGAEASFHDKVADVPLRDAEFLRDFKNVKRGAALKIKRGKFQLHF